MEREEHRKRSKALLGRDWREVHEALDAYFYDYTGWHRLFLHHAWGVEEIVRRFGESSRRAVEMHIRDDFDGRLPADPEEVSRYYIKLPVWSLAGEIVAELRRLYGQDFGLARKWGVED